MSVVGRGKGSPVCAFPSKELSIIDPHVHLFDDGGMWPEYSTADLAQDFRKVPNVRSAVFVECGYRYHKDTAPHVSSVGETMAVASLWSRIDAFEQVMDFRIVGFVDLCDTPNRIEEALGRHMEAGKGQFAGVRQVAAWDPDPKVQPPRDRPSEKLYLDSRFREGFSSFSKYGLTFDAWVYHPQIEDLINLAAAHPNVRIVANHMCGPLGVGRYSQNQSAVFDSWRAGMLRLAEFDNVYMKFSGLGMGNLDPQRFLSEGNGPKTFAIQAVEPWFTTVIEAFGPKRVMFASNFPVDRSVISYSEVWKAWGLLAHSLSPEEREDLMAGTARKVYGFNE